MQNATEIGRENVPQWSGKFEARPEDNILTRGRTSPPECLKSGKFFIKLKMCVANELWYPFSYTELQIRLMEERKPISDKSKTLCKCLKQLFRKTEGSDAKTKLKSYSPMNQGCQLTPRIFFSCKLFSEIQRWWQTYDKKTTILTTARKNLAMLRKVFLFYLIISFSIYKKRKM